MSARDEILANIRRSLRVGGNETIRRQIATERLERAPKGLVPSRGQLPAEERLALFKLQAEAALATVTEVDSSADVPQSIATFLRDHNLPATLRMGSDLRLTAMPWNDTSLEIAHGPSQGSDLNAVSHAFGGVAETGTLVLVSGPENPSTLNFLPDNHIIIVSAKDVAGDYETVWNKVRFAFGKSGMPRTVNWITGPSRSGDIEQTMLLGAHGPRRLHIVVVRD
ncbi:LutC/YkgG family protein [Microvirga rosea]|uniref:LutC/YkgG family protein n=1 Tax=Microvirga rosea TaxID=2715425 RepID=UPI001D0A214F|nr:lactate utilization protein [Microvirga rosea]MCB8820487.1 lactate utilization protein [Microvirga rosea]